MFCIILNRPCSCCVVLYCSRQPTRIRQSENERCSHSSQGCRYVRNENTCISFFFCHSVANSTESLSCLLSLFNYINDHDLLIIMIIPFCLFVAVFAALKLPKHFLKRYNVPLPSSTCSCFAFCTAFCLLPLLYFLLVFLVLCHPSLSDAPLSVGLKKRSINNTQSSWWFCVFVLSSYGSFLFIVRFSSSVHRSLSIMCAHFFYMTTQSSKRPLVFCVFSLFRYGSFLSILPFLCFSLVVIRVLFSSKQRNFNNNHSSYSCFCMLANIRRNSQASRRFPSSRHRNSSPSRVSRRGHHRLCHFIPYS